MSTRPSLFEATLLRVGDRLIAFAGNAWAREAGGWKLLEPLPRRTQKAYLDPTRGVVLLGWDGQAFVRRTWGGEELDRFRLPVEVQSIDSAAFDASTRTLVVCGGEGGLTPWTFSLHDDGNVQMHEVSLRHVVWDAGRGRIVGLQDCEVGQHSVSSVPPRVGPVQHGVFQPGPPLGVAEWAAPSHFGRAWSSLAYDEARAAVIFFAQAEPGGPATLHVLNGTDCVAEALEAPPLNLFHLVHDGASWVAYGGQAFEGNQDSLWRLDGDAWREVP